MKSVSGDESSGQSALTHSARWLWVCAAAAALHLIYLPFPELIPEEAYYWQYAQHLDWGYLDHPPMVGWLIYAGTAVFGQNEFGVRIAALICWLIGGIYVFRLSKLLAGEKASRAAVVFYALLPYFFVGSFFITPDSALMACWAAALYYLYLSLVKEQSQAWLKAGICIGLGLVSKYTAALLGISALVFVLFNRSSRGWLLKWQPYAAALIAVALFSPVLYWNASHGFASFAFQGSRQMIDAAGFSLHWYLLNAVYLVGPSAVLGALWLLCRRRDLLSAGEKMQNKRAEFFVLVFFLLPFLVFALYSLKNNPRLNWAGPAFLVLLPALSRQFCEAAKTSWERWLKRSWPAVLAVLFVFYLLGLHYASFGFPGIGYSAKMRRFLGWHSLAQGVLEAAREIEAPLVAAAGIDKHNISSELAFYMAKGGAREGKPLSKITARHIFGLESLMHKHWTSPDELKGASIILIARRESDFARIDLEPYFERLGPLRTMQTSLNGKPVARYFYRVGERYKGREP